MGCLRTTPIDKRHTTDDQENSQFERSSLDIYMTRDERRGLFVSLYFTAGILPLWEFLVLFSSQRPPRKYVSHPKLEPPCTYADTAPS